MPEEHTWLTLRITTSLRDWVKAEGKAEHRTMSAYVVAKLERERERVTRKTERQAVEDGVVEARRKRWTEEDARVEV